MVSVEDAYRKLAAYVLGFVGSREWESAGCRMQVFTSMATGSQWLMFMTEDMKRVVSRLIQMRSGMGSALLPSYATICLETGASHLGNSIHAIP